MTPLSLAHKAHRAFDEGSFVETLIRFAAIDSGTRHVSGINTKVNHYKRRLEVLGFEVTLRESDEYGNDLAAVLEGEGGISLALIGHVDTVYALGAAEQHPPRIEGNRLYGLGVDDMHGGNLLMVEAIRFLRAHGFKRFRKILVILNNDEENVSMHSRPWTQQLLREHQIDVGLEFESQEEKMGHGIHITDARRALLVYQLKVSGQTGHAGLGEGINAVRELVAKLDAIYTKVAQYPGMSVNETNVYGGHGLQISTTPGDAGATLAFRSTTPEEYYEIERMLREISQPQNVSGTRAMLTPLLISPPPYTPTPQIQRLASLGQGMAYALELPFSTSSKGGTSDANAFAEIGIPVLASLGPVGGGDHNAEEEHILLGEPLHDKFAFVVGLIARICQEWQI